MKTPMRHHLKKTFLPHQANHHRPYLIRPISLALLSLFVVASQFIPQNSISRQPGQVLAYATDITPVQLLQRTNTERTKVGLAPLRLNDKLNSSAGSKADNMIAENYWAHDSPSGLKPWHWFDRAGYSYAFAGENLAKDFDTSAGVTAGWMNSTTHRDNLLNKNYADIGFAVVNGVVLGQSTTLVVAHYGTLTQATAIASKAVVPAVSAAPRVTPAPLVRSKTKPAPTPVATPDPTPVEVVSEPAPSPEIAKVESAPSATKQYSFFSPLLASKTLAIGSQLSLSVLFIVLGVMLISHFTVWRRRIIHGYTHSYKLRAATEMAFVGIGIVVIVVRSFGSVS